MKMEELPQFGQDVPEAWQAFLVECTVRIWPSEWAGYKINSRKIVFVQVAYSIWGHLEDEKRGILPKKYRVYFGKEDNIGKEVESSKLFKFAESPAIEESSSPNNLVEQLGATVVESTKSKPDKKEGWRYIKQAKKDLEVARSLKKQNAKFSYMVCFLSQQVAEKALEGLVIARCGKFERGKDHSWHKLETKIRESEVDKSIQDELIKHVKVFENYYIETRYPNQSSNGNDIPADHYTKEDAKNAVIRAEKVLGIATSNMDLE